MKNLKIQDSDMLKKTEKSLDDLFIDCLVTFDLTNFNNFQRILDNSPSLITHRFSDSNNLSLYGKSILESLLNSPLKTEDEVSKFAALLIDRGSNLINLHGLSAIHYAAKHDYPTVIHQILLKDVTLLTQDFEGWTPIHFAIANSAPNSINTLFEYSKSSNINIDQNIRVTLDDEEVVTLSLQDFAESYQHRLLSNTAHILELIRENHNFHSAQNNQTSGFLSQILAASNFISEHQEEKDNQRKFGNR